MKHPQQLGRLTRGGLVLLRLAAASEVFRVGYLVGSYRQVGGWVGTSVGLIELCSAPVTCCPKQAVAWAAVAVNHRARRAGWSASWRCS